MLSLPLNKGDFYETHVANRLALIHFTCGSSLQFELQIIHANTPTAQNCFKNVTFRHHYAIQKNLSSIKTELRHLSRVLHFNRQVLC